MSNLKELLTRIEAEVKPDDVAVFTEYVSERTGDVLSVVMHVRDGQVVEKTVKGLKPRTTPQE